jgi:hypothetical protein
LARNDAGFINDGLVAGEPVLDAVPFEVALLEAGVCANRAEHKTKLVKSNFI